MTARSMETAPFWRRFLYLLAWELAKIVTVIIVGVPIAMIWCWLADKLGYPLAFGLFIGTLAVLVAGIKAMPKRRRAIPS